MLSGIREPLVELCANESDVQAITWERVKLETNKDPLMIQLKNYMESVFPLNKQDIPASLAPFWPIRDQLFIVDGVILRNNDVVLPSALRSPALSDSLQQKACIIIPPVLRDEVLQTLHAAHQGTSAMNDRARAGLYWPGITKDIEMIRGSCSNCHRIAPSQSRLPPRDGIIPTMPFEAIVADYFNYKGHYYLVVADRLSGWTEQQQIKVGTNEAGSSGLCKALRRIFVTFGVPVELSSDGGPEFAAAETSAFMKRWGVRHRKSSVSLPSSNGRAELAVKSTKRLLMDNVGPNGNLVNDKMVRALLVVRNTPDPGCKLSPAEILFGRPLRDTLPYINQNIMCFNNPQFSDLWRNAWRQKEVALRDRYVKTLETLKEHSRALPALHCGDHVMVQNQTGQFPNKWDKSGIVVEVKDFDQYVVKVTGSGRLTLRNRRFLRKYVPHSFEGNVAFKTRKDHRSNLQAQSYSQKFCSDGNEKHVCSNPNDDKQQGFNPILNGRSDESVSSDSDVSNSFWSTTSFKDNSSDPPQKNKLMLSCLNPHNAPGVKEKVIPVLDGQNKITFGDIGDIPASFPVRRSTRVKSDRKMYDAASGQYVSCKES